MRQRHLALGALPVLLAAMASAQTSPGDWKIRPHLRSALASAADNDKLPVYFVMRDRLGYGHWYPRIQQMDLATRRALVTRELKEHCQRTQAGVLADLRSAEDSGGVSDLRCNWLGNFIRAQASRDAIYAAAARDDVWEIWHDVPLARDAVEDGAPASSPGLTPGNAPAFVGADRVWALGFRGQGVLVMNADSGINVDHRALRNNLWYNPGEIRNGIDDDGNGFIDDINGWAFDTNTNFLDDNGGHGTNSAGVLVADDSCNATAYGIAPSGTVMTGKIWTEADQWDAIQYALDMGAHTQTSSHSYKNDFTPPPNYMMHRDIGDATLAAGLIRTNSTSNNGGICEGAFPAVRRPFNVSVPGNLPPPYFDPNQVIRGTKSGVIGVGAQNLRGGILYSQSPCGPSAWHLDDLLVAVPSYPLANWNTLLHNDYPWAGGTQMGLLKPDIVAPTGTQTTVGSGAVCTIGNFGGTSNATPVAAGSMMLWKGANMSLGPEDIAMVLHQSAQDAGSVPGKENSWGAGLVDAYAGLRLALAVHRVNGEPAWEVTHRSGTRLSLELDGSENRTALFVIGVVRQDVNLGILTSGVGSQLFVAFAGSTGSSGTTGVSFRVPPTTTPYTVYSQVFVDDTTGPTGSFLTSNVVGIRVEP